MCIFFRSLDGFDMSWSPIPPTFVPLPHPTHFEHIKTDQSITEDSTSLFFEMNDYNSYKEMLHLKYKILNLKEYLNLIFMLAKKQQ